MIFLLSANQWPFPGTLPRHLRGLVTRAHFGNISAKSLWASRKGSPERFPCWALVNNPERCPGRVPGIDHNNQQLVIDNALIINHQ